MPQKLVSIPLELARLLAAEPEDFKRSAEYEGAQRVARALLRTLLVGVK